MKQRDTSDRAANLSRLSGAGGAWTTFSCVVLQRSSRRHRWSGQSRRTGFAQPLTGPSSDSCQSDADGVSLSLITSSDVSS